MKSASEILAAIQAQNCREVAGLDLHVRALISAAEGDLGAAAEFFLSAQQYESAHGYARAALHTSHQAALTANLGGDLERLRRYYQETMRTLKRMRNREGLALCLRSVGEIALVNSDFAELEKAWRLSEKLFSELELPESQHISDWITCARSIT